MKRLIAMAIVAVAAIEFVSAAPEVTDITAKQRYPWNGLVDITCKVSGIEADAGGYEFAVVAVDKDTGKEYTVSTFSIQHNGEEVPDVCGNGDYSLLWNAREDMGQIVIERMAVRVTLEALAASVGKVQLWEGGPYWADRNIGAKKPEDSGLYFWWGDTTGHRQGFAFYVNNPAIKTVRKNMSELKSAGWITSDGILVPIHDAAHVKWGGEWRMPTRQELKDLCSKCDWIWTTINGVQGYIVSGRGLYGSNSIFLPAASYVIVTSLDLSSTYSYYWSSEANSDYENANCLAFTPTYHETTYYYRYRYYGQSIRPVQ